MDNNTGPNHGRKVVRKCKKHGKQWEHYQTADSVFGTIWPSKDRKKVRKRPFSQRIVFTLHLGFADDFRRRSYPKRQKRHFFARGPNPKVLIMRWKRS